jgi:hypothetical protein
MQGTASFGSAGRRRNADVTLSGEVGLRGRGAQAAPAPSGAMARQASPTADDQQRHHRIHHQRARPSDQPARHVLLLLHPRRHRHRPRGPRRPLRRRRQARQEPQGEGAAVPRWRVGQGPGHREAQGWQAPRAHGHQGAVHRHNWCVAPPRPALHRELPRAPPG